MKWLVTSRFKAEIESRIVVDAPTIDDCVKQVQSDAEEDQLENFQIVDVQPFITIDREGEEFVN